MRWWHLQKFEGAAAASHTAQCNGTTNTWPCGSRNRCCVLPRCRRASKSATFEEWKRCAAFPVESDALFPNASTFQVTSMEPGRGEEDEPVKADKASPLRSCNVDKPLPKVRWHCKKFNNTGTLKCRNLICNTSLSYVTCIYIYMYIYILLDVRYVKTKGIFNGPS